MVTDGDRAPDGGADELWERYGRSLLQGMQEVLADTPAELHALLLETADYWLSVGLAMGSERPAEARRLLAVIEAEEAERLALAGDAAQLVSDVLE